MNSVSKFQMLDRDFVQKNVYNTALLGNMKVWEPVYHNTAHSNRIKYRKAAIFVNSMGWKTLIQLTTILSQEANEYRHSFDESEISMNKLVPRVTLKFSRI